MLPAGDDERKGEGLSRDGTGNDQEMDSGYLGPLKRDGAGCIYRMYCAVGIGVKLGTCVEGKG